MSLVAKVLSDRTWTASAGDPVSDLRREKVRE
jgi:hypothetical protein